MTTQRKHRINVGCGMSPTIGWHNYDNSASVKLATRPTLFKLLNATGFIDKPQRDFIEFCRSNSVAWADATKHIPHADSSIEVVYASHMFEHLDSRAAKGFLSEVKRVLRPGGILRLAVPNIAYHIANYRESGDADRFMRETYTVYDNPRGIRGTIGFLLVGPRNHRWMYDGQSLSKLLTANGFKNARAMPPGETLIADSSPLDLYERLPESVFVEAVKP